MSGMGRSKSGGGGIAVFIIMTVVVMLPIALGARSCSRGDAALERHHACLERAVTDAEIKKCQ